MAGFYAQAHGEQRFGDGGSVTALPQMHYPLTYLLQWPTLNDGA